MVKAILFSIIIPLALAMPIFAETAVPPVDVAPSPADTLFEEELKDVPIKVVPLQCLDKSTGRVQTIEANVGQTLEFGTLKIDVIRAYKSSPDLPPETKVYLEIWSLRPDETFKKIFAGWMFASSRSISCLEDPTYDVWVEKAIE